MKLNMIGLTTASPQMTTWLLEQAPITVILCVVIWWLSRKLNKVESERDEISREVIKLATLWEKKTEQSEEGDVMLKREILKSLEEIKNALNKK